MADLSHDAMYHVYFVPTIADLSAPTTTEITSGTRLDPRMTPTGLTRDASTDTKDTSKLNSTFSTQAVGRRSFNLSIEIVREVGDTSGVEAALQYGVLGNLVVCDEVDSGTALASGDKVEVYPVQVGQGNKSAPAANEDQKITYSFMNTADPVLDAAMGV